MTRVFSDKMTLPLAHWRREDCSKLGTPTMRPLPWREMPSVYGTWLSEIMLQQTRVDTGIPKWHAFRETFPDVAALASASEEEVLKAWEGLGYYRRARLLHRAAQAIHDAGRYPETHADWLSLPGIGPYSAAAISSIAFGSHVAAVDGNVQRVASRWNGVTEAVDSKSGIQAIQAIADAWLDPDDPGRHNQAVMEIGALVCKPKAPECDPDALWPAPAVRRTTPSCGVCCQ